MYESLACERKSWTTLNFSFKLTYCLLPLFYLREQNLRALTSVAKNASVEINLYLKVWIRRWTQM